MFSDWINQKSLPLDVAARLFGVSRRTVERWRQRGEVSRCAWVLMRSIDAGAAPLNASLHRGPRVGLPIYELRDALWPGWREHRTPDEIAAAEAMRRRAERWAADRERARADRARRAARTRAARRAAAAAAAADAAAIARALATARAPHTPPQPPIAAAPGVAVLPTTIGADTYETDPPPPHGQRGSTMRSAGADSLRE